MQRDDVVGDVQQPNHETLIRTMNNGYRFASHRVDGSMDGSLAIVGFLASTLIEVFTRSVSFLLTLSTTSTSTRRAPLVATSSRRLAPS